MQSIDSENYNSSSSDNSGSSAKRVLLRKSKYVNIWNKEQFVSPETGEIVLKSVLYSPFDDLTNRNNFCNVNDFATNKHVCLPEDSSTNSNEISEIKQNEPPAFCSSQLLQRKANSDSNQELSIESADVTGNKDMEQTFNRKRYDLLTSNEGYSLMIKANKTAHKKEFPVPKAKEIEIIRPEKEPIDFKEKEPIDFKPEPECLNLSPTIESNTQAPSSVDVHKSETTPPSNIESSDKESLASVDSGKCSQITTDVKENEVSYTVGEEQKSSTSSKISEWMLNNSKYFTWRQDQELLDNIDTDYDWRCKSIVNELNKCKPLPTVYDSDISIDSSEGKSPPGSLLDIEDVEETCEVTETWKNLLSTLKISKKAAKSRDKLVSKMNDVNIKLDEEIDVDMIFKEKFHITPPVPKEKSEENYLTKEVDFQIIDDSGASSSDEAKNDTNLHDRNILDLTKNMENTHIDEYTTKSQTTNVPCTTLSLGQYLDMFRACAAEIEEANINDEQIEQLTDNQELLECAQVEQLKTVVKTDLLSDLMDHVETFSHGDESKKLKKMVKKAMKNSECSTIAVCAIKDIQNINDKLALEDDLSKSVDRQKYLLQEIMKPRRRLTRCRSASDIHDNLKRLNGGDLYDEEVSAPKRRATDSYIDINQMRHKFAAKTRSPPRYARKYVKKAFSPNFEKPVAYEFGNHASFSPGNVQEKIITTFANFEKSCLI